MKRFGRIDPSDLCSLPLNDNEARELSELRFRSEDRIGVLDGVLNVLARAEVRLDLHDALQPPSSASCHLASLRRAPVAPVWLPSLLPSSFLDPV